MVEVCRITNRGIGLYAFWAISFLITSIALRFIHEWLHGVYAILTGGWAGKVFITQWILFYPIFAIEISGGNPFWVFEGVLITTWLISLLIVIFTSYPFLRRVIDACSAVNASIWLFGVRLGAIFEMFGQAVYALPNLVIFSDNFRYFGGDGLTMALIFEQMGYPAEFQYIIAMMMMVGAFFALIWSLKCDPQFCGYCSYTLR